MKFAPILASLAALIAAPALADDSRAVRQEAGIPFANHGGVDDWRAQDSDTIYFRDQRRQWYRAELFGPANDLPFVDHIGIDASPSGRLDRWGAIYVRGQRYTFRSFERVDGPPVRPKRQRS